MKKIFLLLTLLLVAMPAMAVVTVTCSDEGGGVCKVSYTGGGAGGVRAFALDITLSDGAIIQYVDGNTVSADYYVAPGSVQIVGGNIVSDIVASSTYPGTLAGEGTGAMTIEMGSLYAAGDPAPAASGDLFSFVVDKDCTVTIATNDIRGGVVMEDPDASSGLNGTISTCGIVVGPSCLGDVALSNGLPGTDGVVDLGDLQFLLGQMIQFGNAGDNYLIPYFADGDFALSNGLPGTDGRVDLGDLQAMLGQMIQFGNSAANYALPGCM